MEVEELKASNAALIDENEDLKNQNDLLVQENVRMEDRYNEERKQRVEAQKKAVVLQEELNKRQGQLNYEREQKHLGQKKRHGSIPKFVIVSAVALVVLMASFMLQKLCIIGPSVGYGIQCIMAMVIAWSYAIIWDRARNN